MLSEDQIDLQTAFPKYSKKCNKTRRKCHTNKHVYYEDNNNIHHNLKGKCKEIQETNSID